MLVFAVFAQTAAACAVSNMDYNEKHEGELRNTSMQGLPSQEK